VYACERCTENSSGILILSPAWTKEAGKKLGCPKSIETIEIKIRKTLRVGDLGIRKIAIELGVGAGPVQMIAREMHGEISVQA
jgi:hypothetical protein